MAEFSTPAYTRTALPSGSLLLRLPDHDDLLVAWIVLPLLFTIAPLGLAYPPLLVITFLLFAFLIWVAAPLSWYFFKGHVEVLLSPEMFQVQRKRGPFRRRWLVSLGEVEQLRLTLDSRNEPVALDAVLLHTTVRLSSGEPGELLIKLHAELSELLTVFAPAKTAALATTRVELLAIIPGWRFVVGSGRLTSERTTWLHFQPFETWPSPGSASLAELQRLVLVSTGWDGQSRLIAVLPGPRPWVLAQATQADRLKMLAQQLLAAGQRMATPLPDLEYEADYSKQPALSRLQTKPLPTGVCYFTPSRRYCFNVQGTELTIIWPVLCWQRSRTWQAADLRAIRSENRQVTDGEGGVSFLLQLILESKQGRPWIITCREFCDQDYAWLAGRLRAHLLPPNSERTTSRNAVKVE